MHDFITRNAYMNHDVMAMFYEMFMSKLDLRFIKYHALSNNCLLIYL